MSLLARTSLALIFPELRLRTEVELLPGGDDSCEGSFAGALKRFAKRLADQANERITKAQEGLTWAQGKLTSAQNWLESKKADVDKGHAAFDAAIVGLERAKRRS